MTREGYLSKVNFVKEVGEAIVKVQKNIAEMHYEVWLSGGGNVSEFLVITYTGGAKSVRRCTGNSYSAIFNEISTKLESGYYDEVGYYNKWYRDCEDEERIM